MKFSIFFAAALAGLAATQVASATVTIETVQVGNVGNIGELSGAGAGGYGSDRICGAVSYSYNIGKYEVTAAQYTEFLNKVAGVDTYNLYSTNMWSHTYGCKIERYTGGGTIAAPYQYRVAPDYANRPVNWVDFWDACRFANWLQNGQPTGAQGAGTTETGTYTLTVGGIDGNTITRNPGIQWAVTSEDEWYKAAYHKNDGATGNFWDYATGTDAVPSNILSNPLPDPGNSANYLGPSYETGTYTIGIPYYRTEVGDFENSASPYGTFDQSGNVWEWTETRIADIHRGLRGGSFYENIAVDLQAANRNDSDPSGGGYLSIGFRVVMVPEPASLELLGLSVLAMLIRRRER